MGENAIATLTRTFFTLLFLMLAILVPRADCAEPSAPELTGEFAETVFNQYSLQEAVRMLLEKNIPVEQIIELAQKAGYGDGEITVALYVSGLPSEDAIMGALRSEMDAAKVMAALRDQGVEPLSVIDLLAVQDLDVERRVSVYKFMLGGDFTESGLMEALFRSGMDYNAIGIVAERLGIAPATIVAAYRTVFGGQGKFGHLYTSQTLPQSALITVGVERGRNEISPSRP